MQLRTVFLLLSAGCLAMPGAASAQVREIPVTINSLGSTFVSKGFLRGHVAVYPESLIVSFDSTFIRQHPWEAGRSTAHLDSLNVALTTGTERGGWRLQAQSAAMPVPDSLAERVDFSIGRVR